MRLPFGAAERPGATSIRTTISDVRHERDQNRALDRKRAADVLLETRELCERAVCVRGAGGASESSDRAAGRSRDASGCALWRQLARWHRRAWRRRTRGGGGLRRHGGSRGGSGGSRCAGDGLRRGGPRGAGSREAAACSAAPSSDSIERGGPASSSVASGRQGRFGHSRVARPAREVSEHAVEDLGRFSVRRGRTFVCPLGRFGIRGVARPAREVTEHAVEDLGRVSVRRCGGRLEARVLGRPEEPEAARPIETSVLRSLPKGALSSGSGHATLPFAAAAAFGW